MKKTHRLPTPSAALLALTVGFGVLTPAWLQAQGITYTLSPSARWIDWDEMVGFERTRLLGGSAGLGFGRYVGLSGFYHIEDGIPTNLAASGLTLPDGGEIPSQLTEIRQIGGAVTLGLGSGSIVPVVTGGGSILRFAPEMGARSTQLSLDWGAGFKTVFGETLTGEIMVESSNYRLDRYRLAPGYDPADPNFPVDPNSSDVLRNLTLRAGLGIQLGRRSMRGAEDLDDAFAQRYQRPFSNFALAIEPLMGELDFDAALGLESQRMLGARAGFDFGQFFGLRGFYWRGTESNFQDFGSMRAWGGEAQFTLAAGPGLNPYLIGGAGQLEWDDDFNADPALIPSDQTALIVGGGVDFNFGPRIRATVAARDFILSGSSIFTAQQLQDASDPADLVHNWQLSAGLKFVVGGNGGIRANRPPVSPSPPVAAPPVVTETAPLPAAQPQPTAAPAVVAPAQPAPVTPTPGTAEPSEAGRTTATAEAVATPASPKTMVVPVPERGEIYIRFGDVSGVPMLVRREGGNAAATGDSARATLTEDAIRRLLREEMAAERGQAGDTAVAVPATDAEAMLRRLIREEIEASRVGAPTERPATDEARLQEMERRFEDRLRELEERAATGAPETVVVRDEGRTETVVVGALPDRSTREIRPYTGLAVSGNAQLLLGVAADIGPMRAGSSVNLVPQVALGFGQGPSSLLISLGFEYRLPVMVNRARFDLQPIASIGPSLIKQNDYEAGITTFLGAASRILDESGRQRAYLYYGYQGVDLFDGGRLVVGLRRMR